MSGSLLYSVGVWGIAVSVLLATLPSIIFVLAIDGNGYGSDHTGDNHNQLLFNPYNQYTVDQLLIKMPSVLEEPELADSELSPKILDPPKSDNQNIFKLQLKSLLDSLSLNDSKSETKLNDSISDFERFITTEDSLSNSEITIDSLSENLNDFQSKFNSNISSIRDLPLDISRQVVIKDSKNERPSTVSSLDNHKRHKEPNVVSQSRYRSVKNILSQIRFNCTGREEGYYADPDFDCHIFHYCKGNGFKFTFICPANSVFSQEELQCDSDPVNSRNLCRSSEDFYFINSLVYSHNSTKSLANLGENFDKISGTLKKNLRRLKAFQEPTSNDGSRRSFVDEKNDKIASESIPNFHFTNELSSGSKWNGIELHSSPKKVFKDSIIYTPKGDLPGFRPLFPLTTQTPIVQQIDTPRWFPPVNASSDILNKFDKNGFNVYNKPALVLSSTTSATPTTQNTTNGNVENVDKKKVEDKNKYSSIQIGSEKVSEKRPFLKVKGKPPKRSKIPNGNPINNMKQVNKQVKMKPPYSIQWDDDFEAPATDLLDNNRRRHSQSEAEMDERSPASSNMQQITVRPNHNTNNINLNNVPNSPTNTDYLYIQNTKDANFNPLLMDSPGDFSPIEFDEIFNKIPLRPIGQTAIVDGSPDQAYQHMIDHLRQRPPPRVLAALAREQLKPLRMMINNFLVSGTGNSIAKRQFLITPPQQRPFVPSDVNGLRSTGEKNKLVKRSDRYIFGAPIVHVNNPKRQLLEKLKRIWRPIARRFHL